MQIQQSQKTIDAINTALKESEERFQKLFDSTADDIIVTDINEQIVEVNNQACKTLGYSKQELLNMRITQIKAPEYVEAVAENRKIVYERGSHSFESIHLTKDGIQIPVEFFSRVINY